MSTRSFLTNFARDNLETLNLRRFFGDYRTFAFSPDAFHLGIGEIANITDATTWQTIFQEVDHDDRLVSRATMYSARTPRAVLARRSEPDHCQKCWSSMGSWRPWAVRVSRPDFRVGLDAIDCPNPSESR